MRTILRSPRSIVLLGVVMMLGVVTGGVWLLVALPPYQVSFVQFAPTVTGQERAALINEYRKTLAQVIGGVFVIVGAMSGAFFTWSQIRVARDGQLTHRFTEAIRQLGDASSVAVRLGGIYALERLARDSAKDHWAIMETLSAFVRENATERTVTVRTDIQAALTVLGRRERRDEPGRVNLAAAHLEGAGLVDAHLEGAMLGAAHLEGAHLERANLKGANLKGAHLEGAHLMVAHLDRAKLVGAYLGAAHLEGANLESAYLAHANLKSANLECANLKGADLGAARLEGAYLGFAHLEGAHLERANLEGAHLEGANLEDAHLVGANLKSAHLEGAHLDGAQRVHLDLSLN